ncbi:hypothetical protein H6F47_22945 [Sphaerospermopsis sp. FACHB-1094]|uniref:hypothetical protein n=1 Tax=Sphaerospermopsis sp. FACHB-1094 TaxID=2692861 RepID=UPI001685E95B|nr:hypothetical protein [Sphaerospermopsis sp. FACHB-1094]MBD2135195.1 hypothetical protein [Sphaerospermopsis sp. FACHB-1094]
MWAAVMLACSVIAAWASRPQTDDQRVEYLQRKISSLEAQLNRQQPTYSPSISEPSPSPKAITTPTPSPSPEPTPTSTPTPEPPFIPEPTLRLSDPKWDYSVFNSRKTYSDREIQYILKSGARYDDSNKQVEWIVDEKINCFGGSQLSDGSRVCFNFKLGVEFSAVFKDVDGVTIASQVLFEDGGNNPKREGNITTYRYRYILTIPDSVWSRWSEVTQVIITK